MEVALEAGAEDIETLDGITEVDDHAGTVSSH